jgi:hypothetical protein
VSDEKSGADYFDEALRLVQDKTGWSKPAEHSGGCELLGLVMVAIAISATAKQLSNSARPRGGREGN